MSGVGLASLERAPCALANLSNSVGSGIERLLLVLWYLALGRGGQVHSGPGQGEPRQGSGWCVDLISFSRGNFSSLYLAGA